MAPSSRFDPFIAVSILLGLLVLWVLTASERACVRARYESFSMRFDGNERKI